MRPVWALARHELRTRWAAVIAVGVLVALSTGVVLTAIVGARRTSSSVERFQEATSASDGIVQSNSIEGGTQLRDAIRALPHVQATATRYIVNGFPSGADESTPDFAVYTDPDGHYGTDVDRPLLVRGRMPRDEAPDEVMLDELAAQVLHLDVGDHVQVATWSPSDLESLGSSEGFPGFNGPALDLTVVGVGRTPEGLGGKVGRASLIALAGPRFIAAHPGIGAWPPVVALRVDDPDNLAAVSEEVTALGTDELPTELITSERDYLADARRSVGALATGLWIFASVAAAAALVVAGQAVSRQVGTATGTTETTRALGMTRAARAGAGAIPTVLGSLVGVGVGVALAIALSPLLPTGAARRIEVDQGVWIDGWGLVVGASAAVALLAGWAVAASWRAQRDTRSSVTWARRRSSSIADRLAGWGAPPALVTGVRNTFERRDRLSVPVRSALVASVVAVAGVVGAGVVVASIDEVTTVPARWGWNWSSQPDAFDGEPEPTDQLARDDRLAAVAIESSSAIKLGDHLVNVLALEPRKGSMSFTVLTGRLPVGPSEIALGRKAAQQLGLSIGDVVHADLPDGASGVDLTVVGMAVPPDDAGGPGVTAIMTPDGLEGASADVIDTNVVIRYPAGSDAVALERQLAEDYGLSFPFFSHAQVPGAITNVAQGRGVAVALGAFFALLGIAGLAHALISSTRRRAPDFSVLRAIGFRRFQVRTSVLCQALTIALVGLVIGIPLGLVVGRSFWSRLVRGIDLIDWPSTPWLLVGVLTPIALVSSAIVAWWPARIAARSPTNTVLRGD